ncbi:Phosphate-binding protein PstS (modular protein) [uncultured Eubacteriales bacterium]|uniref:Phosphate-binding protein n=1 Tax=uncultured Eubacteriales bacterium TaxID=172733 RepID=A0A212KAQ7_9FIRM|nr:Phosphate-binding protein PstS (modular protein) [uncultured Eubacteriales bacterium]
MKKRLIALTLAVVTVLAMMASTASAASPINLVVDGKKITPTVDPVVESGTTLVPLRVISETLGADVTWEQSKQQATIKTAAYTVVFTIGSKSYTVNGASKTLIVAPKAANGSTLVPIRAFSESIGATVNYNASTKTASIDYFTKMSGSLKISGSTTLQPIVQAAADKLVSMNSGLSITVSGGGSGTGIKDATAGTVNIGMSSRELTTDEMKSLKVYPVANDGIAIIVNPGNPVKDLTKDQAAKIFLGEIKNWKDVGGNDAPIVVMTRETGSGTRATLEEMILEKKSVVERATPFASSTLIKQAVAKDKNAIGFDSIGFVDSTVKALSLDGKSATSATVISGSYGMGRQLFCLTNGNASGLSAIFIDYLKTQDCQDNIVVKEGYVKLS